MAQAQAQFIDLREIQSTDNKELVKLKEEFNAIATSINKLSQEGRPIKKNFKLIHELFLAKQAIDELIQKPHSRKL